MNELIQSRNHLYVGTDRAIKNYHRSMIGWSGDELNFIVLRFVLLRLVLASVSHYSLFEGSEMQHSMLDLYVRPYATRRYSGSKTKGM